MTNFDTAMKDILSEADAEFIGDTIDETGFYQSVWGSFRGKGGGMSRMAWCGILIAGGLTILFVYLMLVAESVDDKITCAAFAIMLNCAQIALKLWFNMQMNRRALSHEIRKLQLAVMAKS